MKKQENTLFVNMRNITIWQKYIYDCEFDSNEFPIIHIDNKIDEKSLIHHSISTTLANDFKFLYINISELVKLEKDNFYNLINELKKSGFEYLVIKNDQPLISSNSILTNAYKCYIYSFVQKIQDVGMKSYIIG